MDFEVCSYCAGTGEVTALCDPYDHDSGAFDCAECNLCGGTGRKRELRIVSGTKRDPKVVKRMKEETQRANAAAFQAILKARAKWGT